MKFTVQEDFVLTFNTEIDKKPATGCRFTQVVSDLSSKQWKQLVDSGKQIFLGYIFHSDIV